MSLDEIRANRTAREAQAKDTAAALPAGDYYADGHDVRDHATRAVVASCASHWDACLVMMAAARK